MASVNFDTNGHPHRDQSWINGEKVGKCDVVQWGTLVQDIVEGTLMKPAGFGETINPLENIGGHRYDVTHGLCEADPFLEATSEGFCCNQRLSKVTYTFRKHCTIGALMATCGPKGWNAE